VRNCDNVASKVAVNGLNKKSVLQQRQEFFCLPPHPYYLSGPHNHLSSQY
jgi:hypothetical protein